MPEKEVSRVARGNRTILETSGVGCLSPRQAVSFTYLGRRVETIVVRVVHDVTLFPIVEKFQIPVRGESGRTGSIRRL